MIRKAILLFMLGISTLLLKAGTIKNDSLRFEMLLSGKMLYDIKLTNPLIHSLDISSNRLVLLSTHDQFYLLGWGGIKPYGIKQIGDISSFAFTSDTLLMVIRNAELCCFDSAGKLKKIFDLPHKDMAISRGKLVMYLFDRGQGLQKYAIYVLAKNGMYNKLIEISKPLSAVTEYKNTLLYASGQTLFSYDIKKNKVKTLTTLTKNNIIKSIAVDTLSNRIYFSTDSMVCTLIDTASVIVSDKFGGELCYFNKGLIVFNSERKYLIRITGLEAALSMVSKPVYTLTQNISETNKPEKSSDTLTNSSVIAMVNSEYSDEYIISLINKSKVNFNVSVNSMIELSNQKVSSQVILAMKNAMKNQSASNVQVNTTALKYYIIAGSYPTEKEAIDAVALLKGKGYPEAEIIGKNQYNNYRVAYKGFANNDDASAELLKIKQSVNSSAWIFKKE